MAGASNSSILIKRSTTTGRPSTLKSGELAYSYLSNTIFIGTSDGTSTLNVGGQYYTSQIDNASSTNNPNAIVKRDAAGNSYFGNVIVSGTITGTIQAIASAANTLYYPQNFGISGGDMFASNISFNGSSPVILSASLNTVPGLSSGTYGSTTAIPVIGVSSNGRVTSISTAAINTSFNIGSGAASNTINSGATLYFAPNTGSGIVTTIAANTVQFNVDNTILRSNTSGSYGQTISTDLNIVGNLVVRGTTTQVDSNVETTTAGTIGLAANNTGDVIDIGFYGNYTSGSNKLTGLIRSPGTSNFYLFNGINSTELTGNTIPVADFTGANSATLYANVYAYSATVNTLTLTNALTVANGGTGATTFNNGQLVSYNGSALVSIANSALASGQYANANTIAVFTTDAYGKLTNVSNTPIAITAAQITSGQLPVQYGGTGAATLTTGQILLGNGTGAVQSLANSALAAGQYANANTIAVFTTDVYGRVTAVTNTAISGLTVSQGGTGTATFNNGQIVVGNGTGALQSLANSALAAGQYANANTIAVITTDVYGRVTAVTNTAISITPTQINSTTGTGAVVLATGATFNASYANASWANVTTANINAIYANTIAIGGGLTYAASGLFAGFSANSNGYQQVVIENANTGTQASADFIVSTGISSDGAFFGDFGMNGQNFSGSGALNTANNVYLYSANVDLAIGTSTSNAIHFVVNNGATDAATIAANGLFSLATALSTAYGGTGASSFTAGQILIGNGSGALQSLANSALAAGQYANANTIAVFTTDAYGRITAVSNTAISGLTVSQGGTGAATFTTNAMIYGNGSGALQATAAAGTSDQLYTNQVLTVNNSGVPVWASAVDGGTF